MLNVIFTQLGEKMSKVTLNSERYVDVFMFAIFSINPVLYSILYTSMRKYYMPATIS